MGVKPGPVDKMVVLSARPKPTQTTMADGVRSTLYKAYQGELSDLSLLQVSEIYKDMACAPLITTMGISSEVPLVDSALGKVQAGSPLSYQQPLTTSRQITFHPDAPPPPPLPLQHYRLDPSNCMFVCSEKEQLFIASLETTWDMAHKIEAATKDQSMVSEWHQLRRPRLTSSHFREVCHVRGPTSAEHLADRILRGTPQTLAMKRGLEMEAGAVREYCQSNLVNYSPCGFVIHPDAPWLGSSPDGLIYDPTESPPFGLLEVKCPHAKSYVDCSYLKLEGGNLKLKRQHAYFWQVQGQLLVTGLEWCDFVVFAEEDMLVQRLYKDSGIANTIRERADHFFFYFYMPRYLTN
ncbi:uncharacterized protein LOC133121214 [Conger conger]|uniref:uncharacterized protein LOC133121214 n=1 Tax=Conger conger TaxID=82655 RepID=UPI002A5A1727|nr:uncharacterized protein LOC133121214 [Conger conger]